jgi:hypothetical protein
MCTYTKCKPHVVAERADVCAGITLDTEQDEAPLTGKNLKFLDGADPEDALDRTLPWRALVESSRELRADLFNSGFVNITMQPHQADIFLIVLEEERGEAHRVAEHDQKQTGNLRVECSCMTHLAAEHLSHPGSYLMTRRASRLVNDDYSGVIPQMKGLLLICISGHPIHSFVW